MSAAAGKAIALVQGASRGIGLQFARVLSQRENFQVVAVSRFPEKSEELKALAHVDIRPVDVSKENEIEDLARYVKQEYGKMDLIINSSAMLHPSGRGETSLANVDFDSLQATFGVNTFGPLCVAKHFAPLLQKGSGLVGSGSSHAAILVNMSARVGSIGDNGLGGWYSYRMSKAALNMATKNLSIELGRGKNKVICLSLHPGTVETDLSRPYHKNVPKDKLFTSEYSVKRLLEVIDGASVKDTGKYIDWDGKEIPF